MDKYLAYTCTTCPSAATVYGLSSKRIHPILSNRAISCILSLVNLARVSCDYFVELAILTMVKCWKLSPFLPLLLQNYEQKSFTSPGYTENEQMARRIWRQKSSHHTSYIKQCGQSTSSKTQRLFGSSSDIHSSEKP